jgi:hypothetical protein
MRQIFRRQSWLSGIIVVVLCVSVNSVGAIFLGPNDIETLYDTVCLCRAQSIIIIDDAVPPAAKQSLHHLFLQNYRLRCNQLDL